MRAKSLQSCPTLCDPMNCSWPDSSVHKILLASRWAQNKVSPKNWNCLAREKGSGELSPWRSSCQDEDPLHARNHARYIIYIIYFSPPISRGKNYHSYFTVKQMHPRSHSKCQSWTSNPKSSLFQSSPCPWTYLLVSWLRHCVAKKKKNEINKWLS